MRIAIDTAGGDFAPRNIVDGAVVAARHLGFGLILVGDRASIEAELARQPDAARLSGLVSRLTRSYFERKPWLTQPPN